MIDWEEPTVEANYEEEHSEAWEAGKREANEWLRFCTGTANQNGVKGETGDPIYQPVLGKVPAEAQPVTVSETDLAIDDAAALTRLLVGESGEDATNHGPERRPGGGI